MSRCEKCSGCQLSNMTYEQQLEWKQKDTENYSAVSARYLKL